MTLALIVVNVVAVMALIRAARRHRARTARGGRLLASVIETRTHHQVFCERSL